jgi:hypothetical protein
MSFSFAASMWPQRDKSALFDNTELLTPFSHQLQSERSRSKWVASEDGLNSADFTHIQLFTGKRRGFNRGVLNG